MSNVFILIEQALGYCLLKANGVKNSDELITLLKDKNFENVKGKVKLAEFQPFSSVNNASLNCQDIANGCANEDLLVLLRNHLSEGPCVLVLSDRKLLESLKNANINDSLEFSADSNMVLHLRRIRHSINEFMNDKVEHLTRAHIGLGHSFSRMKIKYNVNRADNMIIQSINLLDQLDKDINSEAMRLREWFGYHYPELVKLANDNKMYATVVGIIKSRAGAVEEVIEKLELAMGDSARAQQVIVSARTSMGYELTEEDLLNIGFLASKTLRMMNQRESTAKYLSSKMSQVAPNFSTLVGDIVAARLISHAGSLMNLAKFPASTIQILGAEKALFRALKTRTNTPKYGLIFHSSFIGRAAKNDKGRISRFLAAKISLAVRLDCFMEEPMNIYGLHLKRQVEDQLKYLETGEEPRKNYEAMEEAVVDAKKYIAEMKDTQAALDAQAKLNVPELKKVKKEKKKSVATKDVIEEVVSEVAVENVELKKKKKKKSLKTEVVEEIKVETIVEPIVEIKIEEQKTKKKSKKSKTLEPEMKMEVVEETPVEATSKKSKKRKSEKVEEVVMSESVPEKKVKKEKKSKVEDFKEEIKMEVVEVASSEKKKSKKSKK